MPYLRSARTIERIDHELAYVLVFHRAHACLRTAGLRDRRLGIADRKSNEEVTLAVVGHRVAFVRQLRDDERLCAALHFETTLRDRVRSGRSLSKANANVRYCAKGALTAPTV